MIWLFVILSLALTGAFVAYAYLIREDRTAFASSTRTPARYMSDNIDHFVIKSRLLYLKTIAMALTPAVLLGVISVLMWGQAALILIPVVGIVFGGPLEFILGKIALKNDGKKIEDLFDRIFGLIAGDVLRLLENIMKVLMMIIMMYIPVMIAMDAWDISNLIAIPVVFLVFYYLIMANSYSAQRKISMIASSGFAIVTILAIVFAGLNVDFIVGMRLGYQGSMKLNSFTELTLAISFVAIAVLSFRTVDNTNETTRNAQDQTYVNRMNAVNRATVVIGAMIWGVITIAVVNYNPAMIDATIMNAFNIVLESVFGSIYKYVIAFLGLSILFSIEYDAHRVRHYIIKMFKKDRARREVKLKAVAFQTIILVGPVLLISTLKWDTYLFELIVFINMILMTIYLSTVYVWVQKKFNKLWALIPLAAVILAATMAASVMVSRITLGELSSDVEAMFSLSMGLIIGSLVMYRAHTLSSFVKLELEDYRGF